MLCANLREMDVLRDYLRKNLEERLQRKDCRGKIVEERDCRGKIVEERLWGD